MTEGTPSPLGPNLRTSRERLRLSQEAAARELDVSYRTVQRWERNETTPDWDTLLKITRLYDCAVADLYEPLEDERDPESNGDDYPKVAA